MAPLNVQYTAPLPPGFQSGTVELKSRTTYVDAAGRANQPTYRYTLNADGSLTSLQPGSPAPVIIGMASGDPATASPLDVVVNITASGLPTALRSTFQVLPVDTGGGALNLHAPDINVPVVGPLPATLQALTDQAHGAILQAQALTQQAQVLTQAAAESQDLVLAAVDVAGVTLSLVPQAIAEVKAQGNSAAALAAAAAGLIGVESKAAIPNVNGRYMVLGGPEVGQVYQRVGSTLTRLPELETLSLAKIIADTIASIRLARGQRDGDLRLVGGVLLTWNSTSTEPDDGRNVLAPDVTPGRWIVSTREHGENASRYGIFPNSDAAATTAALQAVLDGLPAGSTLVFQPGATYNLNKEWYINKRMRLIGNGTDFSYTGSTAFSVLIHGTTFDRNNLANGGFLAQLSEPAYEDVTPISGVVLEGLRFKRADGTRGGLDINFFFADDSGLQGVEVRDSFGTGVSYRNCVRPWFRSFTTQNFATYGLFVYQCHGGRFRDYTCRNGGLALDFKQHHKLFGDADHILDGFIIEDLIGFPAYGQTGYNPMWISGARAFQELVRSSSYSATARTNRNFPGHELTRGCVIRNGMLRVTSAAGAGVFAPVIFIGCFADGWTLENIDVDAGGRAATSNMFNIGANGDIAEAQAANITTAGTATFGHNHMLRDIRVKNVGYTDSTSLIQYGVSCRVERLNVRSSTLRRLIYQPAVSALPFGAVERVEWLNNDIECNLLLGGIGECGVAPQALTKTFVTGGNRLKITPVDDPTNASYVICTPVAILATTVQGGEGDRVTVLANPASLNHTITYGVTVRASDGSWGDGEVIVSAPATALGVLIDPPASNTLAVRPMKLNLTNTPTGGKTAMQLTQAIRRVADNTLTGGWTNTLLDTPNRNSTLTTKRTFYGSAPPTTGTHSFGDRMINTAPNLGGPAGWICVSNGTPGSWVASAQIGYRSGVGHPGLLATPLSAQYLFEMYYDTSRPAWYIAVRTASAVPADDWVALTRERTVKVTWDPTSIAAGASQTLAVGVTGAVVGDQAIAVPESGIEPGLVYRADVSGAGVVTITLTNFTAAAIDPASRNWRVSVHPM